MPTGNAAEEGNSMLTDSNRKFLFADDNGYIFANRSKVAFKGFAVCPLGSTGELNLADNVSRKIDCRSYSREKGRERRKVIRDIVLNVFHTGSFFLSDG